MIAPDAFIRTEIRFLHADDFFVVAGKICRKVGRQLPLEKNTRLGIKHLAVSEVPFRRGVLRFAAQTPVFADPDPRRRTELPVEAFDQPDP